MKGYTVYLKDGKVDDIYGESFHHACKEAKISPKSVNYFVTEPEDLPKDKYQLLVQEFKGGRWRELMKPNTDSNILVNFGKALVTSGKAFSVAVFEMKTWWPIYWDTNS